MIRCWNCGTEHESPAPIGASGRELEAEYNRGYRDAIKLLRKPQISHGSNVVVEVKE